MIAWGLFSGEPGNAYLSDFGVATLVGPLGEQGQPLPAVEADDPSGSLGYLSPESIQRGPVTAATDIYSLGVVVFELLTAQHPFHGYHGQELLDKHLYKPFSAARALRPELPVRTADKVNIPHCSCFSTVIFLPGGRR